MWCPMGGRPPGFPLSLLIMTDIPNTIVQIVTSSGHLVRTTRDEHTAELRGALRGRSTDFRIMLLNLDPS